MKKLRRMGKLLLIAVLICATLLLTACASTVAEAEDASGQIGGGKITWSYQKDGATLTISGTGPIDNFESSDAVAWVAVRHSVKTLVVGDGITEIGDYAFYYMPQLENVTIPSSVTKIGKGAFAFCSSMTSISIPDGVTSVGESAFEACSALTSVRLPNSCENLGARAFAFCRSLESFVAFGTMENIGAMTFKNCEKLTSVILNSEMQSKGVDPTAFEGAKEGISVTYSASSDGKSTVRVHYVDENGNKLHEDGIRTKTFGESHTFNSPEVTGYTPDQMSIKVTFGVEDQEYTVTYKSNTPAETAPPSETTDTPSEEPQEPEEPKQLTAGTIVSIVIMVVILVGIAVGAFFLLRSDPKGDSQTVRKNQGNKTPKKGKKK